MGTQLMTRALSLFGLTALFLAVSAPLREQVLGVIGSGVSVMVLYAPYSYIAGVLLVFVAMVIAFNRGSRVR
jgi:hypothetical protein